MEQEVFVFPASFAQQRLWLLNELELGGAAYNMAAAFRLAGRLHVTALKRVLNEIVARHEVLRSSFEVIEDQLVQVISPHATLNLSIMDLHDMDRPERETRARYLLSQEARRCFNLRQGPLLRVGLIRLDEEEHILLFTIHHIVSDGWSMGILFRELATLYQDFCEDQPSSLPALPIQYSDFTVWQRDRLQGEVLQEQLSYWTKQLEGIGVLAFPADRPRPKAQTFHGAREELTLSESLSEALRGLARKEGATLFMTLFAAFTILLHRYSGQDDIVVGSPIAGRNRAEIETLIGFFVNTLVLRTDLSGNPTFRALLGQVREMALGAYAHQDLPFEKLVEELQPERDLSRSPLFQVFFNMAHVESPELSLPGTTVTRLALLEPESKFDLTLYVRDTGRNINFHLVYNNDLFFPDTMIRMLGHLRILLEGIVASPGRRISELPILTQKERQLLLVSWNDPIRDRPDDKCIHDLVEAQVGRSPDSLAISFGDQRLTYSELNQRANQLAHYLRKSDVGPEVLVGLSVERSLEMVIGILGILKAGGAYVPLDPEYPKGRLTYMAKQARVNLLITTERLLAHFSEFEGRSLCLDRDYPMIASENMQAAEVKVAPENLAYVIYTSGSTGKPKGVLGHHRAVANYFSYLDQSYELNHTDVVLQIPSVSFDASIRDLIGPLTGGAHIVILDDLDAKDPEAMLSRIKEHRVTCILSIVPSLLNELIKVASTSNAKYDSLRLILVSGEALDMTLYQKAKRVFGERTSIVNQYGPTESTLTCTYHRVHETDDARRLARLGKPIKNARICILDNDLNLAPLGVPGELYIGGIGVTRGYVNSPELTAERFVPDPFTSEPGARIYKTGDLARYTPDGTIEYLGRSDHQVKIRGFRVELGEIELVLIQHPEVDQAIVAAREELDGAPRLVSYIIPKKGQAPTVDDLRAFLKDNLPDYMVPSDFILLEKFPLTPNRKVDRRALPVPAPNSAGRDSFSIAPRNPIEQRVADIWAEILRLESVGVQDNFFELGGHSLLATRVISRLRQAFQLDLSLRTLFEHPTVADLALQIAKVQQKQVAAEQLTEVLANLELLSEEEAERQLSLEPSKLGE